MFVEALTDCVNVIPDCSRLDRRVNCSEVLSSVVRMRGSQLLAIHMCLQDKRAAAAGLGDVEYRGSGIEIKATWLPPESSMSGGGR